MEACGTYLRVGRAVCRLSKACLLLGSDKRRTLRAEVDACWAVGPGRTRAGRSLRAGRETWSCGTFFQSSCRTGFGFRSSECTHAGGKNRRRPVRSPQSLHRTCLNTGKDGRHALRLVLGVARIALPLLVQPPSHHRCTRPRVKPSRAAPGGGRAVAGDGMPFSISRRRRRYLISSLQR